MVKEVDVDSQFQSELTAAGTKLVIVDFFATWCGPCRQISPIVGQFEEKYPNAVFLKLDVDKCQDTSSLYAVSAMPTFLFFRNKAKIDTHRGADASALEVKIKKWYGAEEEDAGDSGVKGQMDLTTFINKKECECLNESDEHPFGDALSTNGGYLESDCDEQLILAVTFNQAVKLHSLKIHGPKDKGPRTVKIFINQPRTLDFDSAESMEAIQKFDLKPEEIEPGSLIPLRYVKFQNVQNLIIFFKDNQSGEETTQIDYLSVIGSPLNVTNMKDFKRVAGKKGESE